MEDNRLNFNQPLLSVRRGSSIRTVPEVDKRKTNNAPPTIPPLPYYKSELKSGPVRNPGVIPFQWEQIPGRPKDETKDLKTKALEQPPLAPKLPPGRALNHYDKNSDKSSKDSRSSRPQIECDTVSISDTSSLHKNTAGFEKSEDDREEKGSSDSGDENSTYLDALDTLSRTNSFLNCSLSGLSGLEGPGVRPPGTSSSPQARDFIIGRFLPAAQAVASDTPQLGSRKQPVAKEEPRDVKKIVTKDKGNSQNYRIPESLAYPPQNDGLETEDDDDDDDEGNDFGGSENFSSAKLCGLLPWFCLLKSIPGMRDPVPVPLSPVQKIHKKPANIGAHIKSENKAIVDAVYERRRLTVYRRCDMRAGCGANNLKGKLKKLPFQVGSSKLDEASKPVNYQRLSHHSLMQKEKRFLGIPEASSNSWPVRQISSRRNTRIQELLATDQNQSTNEELSSLANPTTVKILYIDSVQAIECQNSNSSSSESRSLTDSQGRTPSMDYLLQDVTDQCSADDKAISQLRNLEPVDCSAQYFLETSNSAVNEEKLKDFQQMRDLQIGSLSLTGLNLQDGQPQGICVQQSTKEDGKKTVQDINLLLPPPLPKSPSESWLSRALPSASSKNTHSRAYLAVGNLGLRASPVDPQWENVVKSTKSHHKQFRLPVLAPVPEK